MQQAAMKLTDFCFAKEEKRKPQVIAATGTGKTYMSAFDVSQVKPRKVIVCSASRGDFTKCEGHV